MAANPPWHLPVYHAALQVTSLEGRLGRSLRVPVVLSILSENSIFSAEKSTTSLPHLPLAPFVEILQRGEVPGLPY
jgi:hypothetical protein